MGATVHARGVPLHWKAPFSFDMVMLHQERQNMIEFAGILKAIMPSPSIAIPQGFVRVSEPHITLMARELSKPVKAELKATWGSNTLPEFPTVTYGQPYYSSNGVKQSIVVDCVEQSEIRVWLQDVIRILMLDVTLDPTRVYHLSVANRTGSPYDSVPDPWNHPGGIDG
jgi:hypothetical protein